MEDRKRQTKAAINRGNNSSSSEGESDSDDDIPSARYMQPPSINENETSSQQLTLVDDTECLLVQPDMDDEGIKIELYMLL